MWWLLGWLFVFDESKSFARDMFKYCQMKLWLGALFGDGLSKSLLAHGVTNLNGACGQAVMVVSCELDMRVIGLGLGLRCSCIVVGFGYLTSSSHVRLELGTCWGHLNERFTLLTELFITLLSYNSILE